MDSHAFCTACGSDLPADAQFCGACGCPVASAPHDAAPVDPVSEPPAAEPVATPASEPAPSSPSSTPRPRHRWHTRVASLLVIALLAAAGGFALSRPSGNDHGREILLEPIASPGVDPFTADVSTVASVVTSTPSTGGAPASTHAASSTTVPAASNVRGVDPTSVGLYGGTLDQSSCDPERLIAFLQGDPAKAQAWAAVEGITVADIPAYIRALTPVVLRLDTRVTNHGYRDGHATAHQSVLQAGTAVLVDEFGIPRARCACGNPLLPPVALSSAPVYLGDAWPGFSVTTVVNVVNVSHTVINNFVLVDPATLGLIRRVGGADHEDSIVSIAQYCELMPRACRPAGLAPPPRLAAPVTRPGEATLRTGVVQVSLRWSSTADLDLSVIDPLGDNVSFSDRRAASGGQLDVDANANCRNPTATPVENVIWPSRAPDGTYTVTVTDYTNCGNPSPSFNLSALVNGQEVALAPVATLSAVHSQASNPGGQLRFTFRKNPVPPARRKPGPPTRVRAVAVGHGAVISWLAPTEKGPGLQSYVVKVNGATFQTPAGQTKVTIPQQLQPGRQYPVQVWAVNANGAGPPATATLTGGQGGPATGVRQPGESLDDYCARKDAAGSTDFDPICGLMAPSVPTSGG